MANKKYLVIGMAALLGASLSFFGCDHGPGPYEPSPTEQAAEALAESAGFTGNTDYSGRGTNVKLTGNVTLSENAEIPAGVTLNVAASALTVSASKTLTVEGTLNVPGNGTLTVEGTLTTTGNGKVTGTVKVKGNGQFINGNGTTVKVETSS
jgi:hypothetical protein